MGKILPILHMMPKDKSKVPRPGESSINFSEETIREFESRYSYVLMTIPTCHNLDLITYTRHITTVGPKAAIILSNADKRFMELFLKLHLQGVKSVKPISVSAYKCRLHYLPQLNSNTHSLLPAFTMRDQTYKCDETGLLFYVSH